MSFTSGKFSSIISLLILLPSYSVFSFKKLLTYQRLTGLRLILCLTFLSLFLPVFGSVYWYFFFFGHDHSMYEFPGEGSNMSHSSDLSHGNDNARSLTTRPPGNSPGDVLELIFIPSIEFLKNFINNRISLVVQWVKDLVLSLQWLRWLL